MRIGVVNWDCSLPPNTFFGSYFAKTLSFKKWRGRTPYYATLLSEDNICCHYRSAEEYDRELEYAINAKIDYFAYVWHSDNKNAKYNPDLPTSITHAHVWTQDRVRKLHQKSELNKKIKLCAIWLCSQPYTESDYASLAEAMKCEYYEKVGNRPIIYLFDGYRTDVIDILRAFPEKYGTEDPYIVMMNNGPEREDGDYSKADAASAYASDASNTTTYSQAIDRAIAESEYRKKYNLDIIPLFTTGFDPTPRMETKVPWVSYIGPYTVNTQDITMEEFEDGAKRLGDWIAQNREYTKTNHIMTFAWNEFEEGGYLCPTYNDDGSVNEERVRTFARIVDMWKSI